LINKDIVSFGCGEEHLVFVNNRKQAFAMGKNQYGQIGIHSKIGRDIISPVLENWRI